MRPSLVVEPMEVLYEMVPYDDRLPSAAAGEEAPQSADEQTGAGGALAKLRGNLGAEAPTSGVLGDAADKISSTSCWHAAGSPRTSCQYSAAMLNGFAPCRFAKPPSNSCNPSA